MFVAAASAIIRTPNHSLQADAARTGEAEHRARRRRGAALRLVEHGDGSALPGASLQKLRCRAVGAHLPRRARRRRAPRAARQRARRMRPRLADPTAQRMLHLAAAPASAARACRCTSRRPTSRSATPTRRTPAAAASPPRRPAAARAGLRGAASPLRGTERRRLRRVAGRQPAAHGEFDRTVAALRGHGTHRASASRAARACPVCTARPPPPPPPPSWRHAFGGARPRHIIAASGGGGG